MADVYRIKVEADFSAIRSEARRIADRALAAVLMRRRRD